MGILEIREIMGILEIREIRPMYYINNFLIYSILECLVDTYESDNNNSTGVEHYRNIKSLVL